MDQIENLIRSLKEDREEPLCAYLYDLRQLRSHVSSLVATLPAQCRLYYAIKANSEAPILNAVAPFVHGFEVASLGEIQRARAVDGGIPILFGGPGKTDDEIAGAIRSDVQLLHVESIHELQRVEYVARRMDAVVPVLLRVNLRRALPVATLQMAGTPTQFGIDETEISDAISLTQASRSVALRGFHFHSISNHLDAEGHARLVGSYLTRAKAWAEEYGLKIEFLNAGGGIGVNYADLDKQFDWPAFTARLNWLLEDECPPTWTVLFECGRYLTASCGYYATEVLDIKRNHGRDYVIVRGGTHQFRLPASWQHSHPFTVVPVETWGYPFPRPELCRGEITVAGQLCTPKDILARDIVVDRVRIGDVILFTYAGAYGWAISHHDFLSHPHPEHIYLD